jgi:hypothetical protein
MLITGGAACGAPAEAPCYDELEQVYENETTPVLSVLPQVIKMCPGVSLAEHPEYQKTTSHTEIRVHESDMSVIEETQAWAPDFDTHTGACRGVKKLVQRHTRVIKAGTFYEVDVDSGKPPERQERRAEQGEWLSMAGVTAIPAATSAISYGGTTITRSGPATVAGHVCERETSKSNRPEAPVTTLCVLPVSRQCRIANLLQPLEVEMTLPDGQVVTRGKTTLLRIARRGELSPPVAISPP